MKIYKFNLKQAKSLLPKRKKTDNKATAGKSLLIAGSEGMFGAAVLAATAAARVGSGYVILMTEQKKFLSSKYPEFLVVDWREKKLANLVAGSTISAIGIGPGLGKSSQAKRLVQQLLKSGAVNVVMDADALNLCAKNKWLSLPKTWVITPHEGELARLLGQSALQIKKNRRAAVVLAQKKLGCVVVLKGDKTLVAIPSVKKSTAKNSVVKTLSLSVKNATASSSTIDHSTSSTTIYEIQSGNAALAKAGTGDVLTGMITGFLAQGLSSVEAACLAAYVHGFIADQWLKSKKDILSLLPTDLLQALPQALKRIRG